jgi:hypothetical protein
MNETFLKPLNDYLIDSRSPDQKMVSGLVSDIKDLKGNPINSPVNPTLTLELQNLVNGVPQIPLSSNEGFYTTTYFKNKYHFLPAVSQYKTNLVNQIQLTTNVVAYAQDISGFSSIGGVTDFSLDFYVSLWLFRADTGNVYTQFSSSLLADASVRLVTIKYTFNFFASDQLNFTIDNSVQLLRLNDFIGTRTLIGGIPDFSTNPTKITKVQYDRLVNNNNLLANMIGYDSTQFTALSANNQNLIYALFGNYLTYDPSTGAGLSIFSIYANSVLTYFGITASYTPAN